MPMMDDSDRVGEGFGLSRWACGKGSKLGRESIICVDARRREGSSDKNLAKLGKGATSRGLNGSATRLPGFTSWVFRAEGCCSATPDGKMWATLVSSSRPELDYSGKLKGPWLLGCKLLSESET